jgi:putative ABC transport system permease protein
MVKGAIPTSFTNTLVRKGLVVLQFGISIIMIIGAGMAFRQLDYLQNKALGFDREHLVVVPLADGVLRQRYAVWKRILLQNPDFVRVTGASSKPGEQTYGRYLMKPANAGEEQAGVAAL